MADDDAAARYRANVARVAETAVDHLMRFDLAKLPAAVMEGNCAHAWAQMWVKLPDGSAARATVNVTLDHGERTLPLPTHRASATVQ